MDDRKKAAGSSCNDGLLLRMGLNDNKAGMQGLDKEKINKIIMEATKVGLITFFLMLYLWSSIIIIPFSLLQNSFLTCVYGWLHFFPKPYMNTAAFSTGHCEGCSLLFFSPFPFLFSTSLLISQADLLLLVTFL